MIILGYFHNALKDLWEFGAVVMWRLAADIFALHSTVCLIEMYGFCVYSTKTVIFFHS